MFQFLVNSHTFIVWLYDFIVPLAISETSKQYAYKSSFRYMTFKYFLLFAILYYFFFFQRTGLLSFEDQSIIPFTINAFCIVSKNSCLPKDVKIFI